MECLISKPAESLLINTKTFIGNLELNSCVYNASGARSHTKEDLKLLYSCSATGAVVSKSCTLSSRLGNVEPRYAELQFGSINSMGIPNGGIDYYLEASTELFGSSFSKRAKQNSHFCKPYFISVSGLSLQENKKIFTRMYDNSLKFTDIELNLSCPNVSGHSQVGYCLPEFEEHLRVLSEIIESEKFGVKLPIYTTHSQIDEVSDIINETGTIEFIVSSNSLGNCLAIDVESETTMLAPNSGFGGLSGSYIKPIAQANVRQFYENLRSGVSIIGCGGISTGRDVFEYILCGASAVQVGTTLIKEGLGCFNRLNSELVEIMAQKGYTQITDFKGKLRTISKDFN